MGRRKRFANLNASLNYLRPVGGGVSPEAPAGTPLRNFQEYRAGRVRRTINRATASNPGAKEEYSIEVFGAPANAAVGIVELGNRAFTALPLGAVNLTMLGLTLRGAGAAAPTYEGIIIPAKATIFRPTSTGAGAPTRSGITGLSYRKKSGDSYTYPFGKITGADRYRERVVAITDGLRTLPGAVVSFTPEDLI